MPKIDNGYSYGMNALIALDQLLNAVLGGSCDETLSSRTHRMARLSRDKRRSRLTVGWAYFEKIVDTIFWLDKGELGEGHCLLSYQVEMLRGHLPKAMVRASILMEEPF
jgi:hypothetical protein